MNLLQLYKRTVPKPLREHLSGIPVVQVWRNRKLEKEGKQLAARIRANRAEDGRIRVVLLETRRAFWLNHASIYESMKADDIFDVQVFAVPKRNPAGEMDWAEYAMLRAFFERENIPCIQAYDCDAERWKNPISFGLPDIVFLSQPYDFQQNFMYSSGYWSRFCQVAYLGYGLSLLGTPSIVRVPSCLAHCRFVFFEHETLRQLFLSRFPEQADKVTVSGHPLLDGYLHPLENFSRIPYKATTSRYRIIWAPHFTVAAGKTDHCFSNFLKYFDVFVQLAQEHPELEIVMKPHPELFKYMVACGVKTEREAAECRKQFEELPNAFIYEAPDYISLFRQSDALVLDSVGFIGAYAPTGKPVCFLESAKRVRLNEIGERLLHADYAAWNAEEIREFVGRVVLGGDDYKKEERKAAVKKLLYMPPEGAGVRIAREIKTRLLAERKREATHVRK